jgi:hypothetical protein
VKHRAAGLGDVGGDHHGFTRGARIVCPDDDGAEHGILLTNAMDEPPAREVRPRSAG